MPSTNNRLIRLKMENIFSNCINETIFRTFFLQIQSKITMTQKNADVDEKVSRYESFLNETLRTDLKNTLLLRDKIYQEQAELLALRNSINAIKLADLVPGEPMKTKVDLGCNFYCQARVTDPSKICISVGLGFFLEMTLDEALKYLDKKDADLGKDAKKLTSDCAKLKANIKLVLGGLRELQNINPNDPQKPQRDIFA